MNLAKHLQSNKDNVEQSSCSFHRGADKRQERQVTEKAKRGIKAGLGALEQKPEVLLEDRGYRSYYSDQNIPLPAIHSHSAAVSSGCKCW